MIKLVSKQKKITEDRTDKIQALKKKIKKIKFRIFNI